jgi:CRP-like cAMP-binding protein
MHHSSMARQVMERLAGATLPEWETAAKNLRTTCLDRDAYLFRAGEPLDFIAFVRSGAIKMVYETPDGHEWIKGFAEVGTVFTSLSSLQSGGTASFSAIALAITEVEVIAYATVSELAGRHLAWQRAVAKAFEIYGVRKEQRERELLLMSAEQRYRNFLKQQPDLSRLLSQKDIASFIRITPVALSRIKARIKA